MPIGSGFFDAPHPKGRAAMANVTLPAAQKLSQAGFLLWAPLGTSLPTNTVTGGVFTDPWPVAWIPLGRTAAGSKIEDNASDADFETAEDYYPIDSQTTKRVVTVSFNLINFTATNLARALNGATTTVTGTTTTTMTQVDSPDPINEVACMIGYESLDSTVRWVGRQVRNTGNLSAQFAKAPNMTEVPWVGKCTKPASAPVYSWFTAGTGRA